MTAFLPTVHTDNICHDRSTAPCYTTVPGLSKVMYLVLGINQLPVITLDKTGGNYITPD